MALSGKKNNLLTIDIFAYLAIVFFIAIFIFLSIGKYESLRTFQNDLGTYSQLTWNTLQGNFFESSGSALATTLRKDGTTQENFNYLSAHFSPILLFFVPFYALWANPKILLILQAIAVGIGALPIYWLAKEKIKSRLGAPIFLVSYLLYPVLHNALLYDFHEVTVAVPIITFALWFWYKKRTGRMLFSLALLLLVQEQTSLIVVMFGLYLMSKKNERKLGLVIFLVGLAYFLLVMLIIIPSFSSVGESALIRGEVGIDHRYSWLGSTLGEISTNVVTHPLMVLKGILTGKRINFLATILLPLIGLPLFSGIFLLSLPILGIYFLSSWWLTYTIYFYHSSILTGIFYFAAIFAFARLFKEIKWQRLFLGLILVSSFLISYRYSVTPWGKDYIWEEYRPSENAKLVEEVKQLIPPAAPLSIQHNLGPHFSTRRKLFHFPFQLDKVDYVIVDVFNPYAVNSKSFFSFGDVIEVNYEGYKTALEFLLNNPDFGAIYTKDGWLVFRRGADWKLYEQAIKEYLTARERLEAGLTQEDLQ